jgi:predicted carbohydrate-binding protein with CBM5 and CBM33 domain
MPKVRTETEIWNRIDTGKGFTSIKEICVIENCWPATIYNRTKKKQLPAFIKIGGSTYLSNASLKDHYYKKIEGVVV